MFKYSILTRIKQIFLPRSCWNSFLLVYISFSKNSKNYQKGRKNVASTNSITEGMSAWKKLLWVSSLPSWPMTGTTMTRMRRGWQSKVEPWVVGGTNKPADRLGFQQSELLFFWALKLRRGATDTEVIQLPDGFKERTKRRGVVCTNWAPQLKILSHPSIGGFLSHSWWTSMVEALRLERPLILLTNLADQDLLFCPGGNYC